MSRPKQDYLPGFNGLGKKEFGASLLGKGNPKEERPLSCKRPLHLVLRSSLARKERSFLAPRYAREIDRLAHELGKKTGVRVYRFANSGNHLHLLVLPSSRKAFRAYVRALSGVIARLVTGAQRGSPGHSDGFWDARPFSRIIEWGRSFKTVCDYLLLNRLEATGFSVSPHHILRP